MQDKKIKRNIPQDILINFQEAERRLKEANGNKSPYQILYELNRRTTEGAAPTSAGIRNEGISSESREQPSVQTDITPESTSDKSEPSGNEGSVNTSNIAESALARTIRKARAKKSITPETN